MTVSLKKRRKYGYDILINTLETTFRTYIINKLFLPQYGAEWRDHIPQGVIDDYIESRGEDFPSDFSIDEYFEELNFIHLKAILMVKAHFKLAKSFLENLSKQRFNEIMDELNLYRRKIAHAKSTFSVLDLDNLIAYVSLLCQGESSKSIRRYLANKEYLNADEVPADFFKDYDSLNNLPYEFYDLDGGFVGRNKELKAVIRLIESQQDRVISITGAGGVGKTALALKTVYTIIESDDNPFFGILWFSAKTSILKDEGIIPLEPDIESYQQFIHELLDELDPNSLIELKERSEPLEKYIEKLGGFFNKHRILLIIDNLETIYKNENLIKFIKEIPRPSQVLITSRRGLGEIERRYPLEDMLEKDAIVLFRIVAKERNKVDLLRLSDESIADLVNSVKCYPLLIKWSIGQVCLGKDINSSFNKIFSGESEIAKFSFNDVFNLLSDDSKFCLYSMIVYGDRTISRRALMHLSTLTEDEFEEAIRELILVSFVLTIHVETESGVITEFSMLSLTRGFIETKFDETDEKIRTELKTRYFDLAKEIAEFEKSRTIYFKSLYSLEIKSIDEQIAFNYVKAAKNYFKKGRLDIAEKNFEEAVKIAPNFAYVYVEYAKFALERGHIHFALELSKRSVAVDPDNFHAWMSYGKILRKSHRPQEAIKCLEKAKNLNRNYLPIDNELGRAYTFSGEYEKADREFEKASAQVQTPNIQHKVIALCFKADNYKRWSEAFGGRKDFDKQQEKIKSAYKTILEAITLRPHDRITRNISRSICCEYGVILMNLGRFQECEKFLKKSIESIEINGKIITPWNNDLARGYFYLAVLTEKTTGINEPKVAEYIQKGLAFCPKKYSIYPKLIRLKNELDEEIFRIHRKFGIIRFFDITRTFGVIDYGNQSCIFFPGGFKERLLPDVFLNLKGKSVSFIPTEGEKGVLATEIKFEEEQEND